MVAQPCGCTTDQPIACLQMNGMACLISVFNNMDTVGPRSWLGCLASPVALGKLLNLSVPPFPYLLNGDKNSTCYGFCIS